jgi:hypothetical protein
MNSTTGIKLGVQICMGTRNNNISAKEITAIPSVSEESHNQLF